MPLAPGVQLGPYVVTSLIGAGGMGEVYRARDTKLNRDVALKVLPEGFTLDADRLARFTREAQVLASLNHPNIGAIHGLEDGDHIRALVLELVEGETLADRIARGAIPIDEALPMARQIVDALEAAHEPGIVHRDLKPANIKLRPDGTVKVLDFGLAKAVQPASGVGMNATASPTITSPATMAGMILGTAAYMSPEQAKGKSADKRSDIWAFGCVLYEMLTGKRAFEGEDVSDTLAAVLRGEPDWSALPDDLPRAIRVIVRRCLDKDRRRRIADISTIRFVVDDPDIVSSAGDSAQPVASRQTAWRQAIPIAIAAIVASGVTAAVVWTLSRGSLPSPAVTRFPVALADTQSFGANGLRLVAISPDGSRIAYATLGPEDSANRATQSLYLRSMSEEAAKPLVPDVQSVIGEPVFSPDGQAIAYYVGPSGNTSARVPRN